MVIWSCSPALFDWPFRVLFRGLIVVLTLTLIAQGATAKSSQRPRVYVDASLVEGLVVAPVPNYPLEALKKNWGGFGVFELQFRPDGTVKDVLTVLTTEHQLLDQTARAALWQWRSKQAGYGSARLTINFSIHHDNVRVDPEQVVKDIPVHPYPNYPEEARRNGWTGTGLFVMRFRADGSVQQVVALKSTDKGVLDEECVRTLLRWRCVPRSWKTAYVPITFSMGR